MNLHEQYKTLMNRGMPEHPTLVWNCIDNDLGPIATLKVCFQKYPVTLKSMVNDAPDARDLLTMHALRWCFGLGEDPPTRGQPIYSHGVQGLRPGPVWFHNVKDDCLDRILEDTKHLENKDE